MAVLPTRSFTTIVSTIAAGVQGRASFFVNFSKGSVFLVLAEAYAGISLWLQGVALRIALLTRLATCYGADVDSFLADFGIITRIGSVPATGLVVFSRYTATGAAPVVQVGSTVRTQDGTLTFAVYADTTNPAYSAAAGGYIMPAQVDTVQVPVRCTTPSPSGTLLADGTTSSGANGNVALGAISVISSQVAGVDTVTNPAAFTTGSDQETDDAVKARFILAINSLSKGTDDAIISAIQSLQTGLQVQVLSGVDLSLLSDPGMVSVIVDDGSGSIGSNLLAAAQVAANNVRAAGIRIGVYAASVTYVQVQLTIMTSPGYTRQLVVAAVTAAVAAGINGLGLGVELDYFSVGSWALAVPGVAKIDGLIINGQNLDIAGDPRSTLKCSGVVVN